MVPTARAATRREVLQQSHRHVGRWLHHGRAMDPKADPNRQHGPGTVGDHSIVLWLNLAESVARRRKLRHLQQDQPAQRPQTSG